MVPAGDMYSLEDDGFNYTFFGNNNIAFYNHNSFVSLQNILGTVLTSVQSKLRAALSVNLSSRSQTDLATACTVLGSDCTDYTPCDT